MHYWRFRLVLQQRLKSVLLQAGSRGCCYRCCGCRFLKANLALLESMEEKRNRHELGALKQRVEAKEEATYLQEAETLEGVDRIGAPHLPCATII